MLLGEYLGNLRIKFQAHPSSQKHLPWLGEDRDCWEMALEAPLPQEADRQEGGDTLRKGSGMCRRGSPGWNHAQLSWVVSSKMRQRRGVRGSDMHPQRPG